MDFTVTACLTDSQVVRGTLALPFVGEIAGLPSRQSFEAELAAGEFALNIEWGAPIHLQFEKCDLLEVARTCFAHEEPATTASRYLVAVMMSNWQMLLGVLEGRAGNLDVRTVIAEAMAGKEQFVTLEGAARFFYINRDAILWIEPFVLDPETQLFGMEHAEVRPEAEARARAENETAYF
ncbi:MAG: hypothetical protein PWP23_909 [Candidatus Sumerlaeota bacterium]|nr:hypothetical protein [Candidatus Sumerlaeota bacterium]